MGVSKLLKKSTFMKKGVSKLLKKINLLEIIENLNLKKATFKKIGVSLGARGGKHISRWLEGGRTIIAP